MITDELKNRVVQLLTYNKYGQFRKVEIDDARLKSAYYHVSHKTQEYYDALANVDQLSGNLPFSVNVAIVYDWI